MSNRDALIDRLIDDDTDTVYNSGGTEYLYNILKYGSKGYDDYTTEELLSELNDRGIDTGDL